MFRLALALLLVGCVHEQVNPEVEDEHDDSETVEELPPDDESIHSDPNECYSSKYPMTMPDGSQTWVSLPGWCQPYFLDKGDPEPAERNPVFDYFYPLEQEYIPEV